MSGLQEEDDVLTSLQSYGACDVADALLRLDHPNAGFLPGFTQRSPEEAIELIGRVFTVEWRALEPDETTPRNYTGHYIDQVPPGDILFSSCPPISQCILGGLMALRLSHIGGKGAIIDGRIRDLTELNITGLPIFSRGVGISAANTVVYPDRVGVPVQVELEGFGSVIVQSGDIVIADENGVVHIPRELEQKVLELLPQLQEQDEKVREAIQSGQTATEAFKLRTIK